MREAILNILSVVFAATLTSAASGEPIARKENRKCNCQVEPCYPFFKKDQKIEGILTSGTQGYVLNVFVPICAKGTEKTPPEEGEDMDWPRESALQVVVSGDEMQRKRLQKAVTDNMGRKVLLTGMPFVAHTSWHHTTILWDTREIELSR